MPVLSTSSSPSVQKIQSRPASLRERASSYARSTVLGAVAPYGDIVDNLKSLSGVETAKPVDFSGQIGDPWIGYKSPAIPCTLKVFGKPLPDGIILTHCTVTDSVDYSPRPVSQLDNASLQLTSQMQNGVNTAGQKALGFTGEARIAQVSRSASTERAAAMMAKARAYIEKHQFEKQRSVNAGLEAIAKKFEDQIDAEVVEKSLLKMYIGDALPRVAELRFVVSDMLQAGVDAASDALLYDRYALLVYFHDLLCRNPEGKALAPQVAALTGRTAAQRITATNIVGRVLQLDSVGLKPYGVKSWVVTRFRHIEVPDTDLIAVQLVVTEFEQTANSNLPKPPSSSPRLQMEPSAAEAQIYSRPFYTAMGH